MSAARTKDNRSVNSDAAARVHLDGESVGDGGHRLHQGQGRLRCGAHRRLLGLDRSGARPRALNAGGHPCVVREDADLRRELVDDVARGQRLREDQVSRPEPSPGALDARTNHAARSHHAGLLVEVELADHVHAQVRHIGDRPRRRLEHNRVRVRVALPLRLRALVVHRVVDVPVRASLHRAPSLRVVDAEPPAELAAREQLERADGRVPVVYEEQPAGRLVDGEVAGGPAASRDGRAELGQLAAPRVELQREDLPFVADGLGARVDDVEARVAPSEGRVVGKALRHS
mmetsp:Transcript_10296/g.30690  ORF Transcript_10296/g.30690 Transcript_10296/m.30690 type:complete len:288 (-) Transcript_10296:390-1253(-)